MTVRQMRKLIKQHKLSQGDVAAMLMVSQPTVNAMLAGGHEITGRNAKLFEQGIARLTAKAGMPNDTIKCAKEGGELFNADEWIDHLAGCSACMENAFWHIKDRE